MHVVTALPVQDQYMLPVVNYNRNLCTGVRLVQNANRDKLVVFVSWHRWVLATRRPIPQDGVVGDAGPNVAEGQAYANSAGGRLTFTVTVILGGVGVSAFIVTLYLFTDILRKDSLICMFQTFNACIIGQTQ